MDEGMAIQSSDSPIRDARLQFVRRTALALLLVGAIAGFTISLLHWLEPAPSLLNRIAPPLMATAFAGLAVRQWLYPQHMASTLWAGWLISLVGLALPSWLFVRMAMAQDVRLVDVLPPIGAVFFPWVLGIALFARPRQALWATLIGWLAVAAPVLVYLLWHPDELWSPRGLDLILALGPLALMLPLLLPLLRGVEERFRYMHSEGERLQELAERDVLIGLYNRRAGERFLSTLLAHSRDSMALILFDIDHFKRINDQFGHPAGDAVLIEVGSRCNGVLASDHIFARWGGEEFLVVLPNASAEGARGVAERMRQAIDGLPMKTVGKVTASFGVTTVRPGDTLSQVVQRADDALYQAKSGGRNRVVSV